MLRKCAPIGVVCYTAFFSLGFCGLDLHNEVKLKFQKPKVNAVI